MGCGGDHAAVICFFLVIKKTEVVERGASDSSIEAFKLWLRLRGLWNRITDQIKKILIGKDINMQTTGTKRKSISSQSAGIGVLGFALHLCTVGAPPDTPPKPPNIVFFLIDDLGWADLGCYGSQLFETPNIDQLASDGMRFTDAYATSPVCMPARLSIMTGHYPQRYGVTWIHKGTSNSLKVQAPESDLGMPLEAITIAEVLKSYGYATFFAGKWHLSTSPEEHPEFQGFDVNIGGHWAGVPGSYFYPYERKQRPSTNVPDLEDGEPGEYLTDRLTDESIRFINEHYREPFFLYLSHYAVHAPIQSKAEKRTKYLKKINDLVDSNKNIPQPLLKEILENASSYAAYAGMVESVDESVGRIVEHVKVLGLENDTVFIFTSDNGGYMSNYPLRGKKSFVWEGGIRVPLIVKWKGKIEAGSECVVPVVSNDFFPTMQDMTGNPINEGLDGVSLLPLLKGELRYQNRPIFWHSPHYHQIYGASPAGSIRQGDYKLIQCLEDNHYKLYKISEDIGETKDLAEQMPEKVKALEVLLNEWRKKVNARMPTPLK